MQVSHAERISAAERDLARRGYSLSHGSGTGLYPDRHCHQGLELIWVERGLGQVHVGAETHLFGAGDALLLDGSEEHSLRLFGGSWVRALLYFSPELVDRPVTSGMKTLGLLADHGLVRARPNAATQARIDKWVADMMGELEQERPGGDAAIAAYLQLILIEMERHLAAPATRPEPVADSGPKAVREVLAYIDSHLHEPVTLDDIGRMVAMSPRHLERCFKEEVGTSLKAFWVDRRMEQAAALLRRPGATVADVATQVGYSSAFSFSRAFKRRYGRAPSRVTQAKQDSGPVGRSAD
jgi:AraC-like DNA-binding protein